MIHAYTGEFAALLVAVFWTITAIAFESASKRLGSLSVNLIRLVLAFIFITVFNRFYRGMSMPFDAGFHQWVWLSVSGFVGFVIGDLCLFKAFTIIGSRLAMLIMTLAPPVAATAGWIWLHERLSMLSILGIVLTLLGIAMAIIGRHPDGEKLKLKVPLGGLLFAIGGALGQAFGLVLSKKGMAGYDAFASTQIRIITGMLGFLAIILLTGRGKRALRALRDRKGMTRITIGSFFGPFLGVSLSLFSLKYTETGIAATIMSTVPVMIIPPSVFIFRQKITVQEVAGAILSVIGVSLFFIK